MGIAPRIQPRQWEFAAVFEGLRRAGALRPGSRGLTFGSGREPLIFAVAAAVGHLTVTDLYTTDTAWTVARTSDPLGFVLAAAPSGFDASRITVRSLDMREIDLPPASIDFCYSVSTFEHIGTDADFLRHLRGVAAVLRPGGVYALTTEVRLGARTFDTPGNHCFALGHLLRLFAEAGLHAEPVFDARLADLGENTPHNLPDLLHRDPANPGSLSVREFNGIISVPALFLLRPGPPQAPEVLGLEDTIAWAEAALQARAARRFSDWVRLNPFGQFRDSRSDWCEPWLSAERPPRPATPIFSTGYHYYGSGLIEARVLLVASAAMTTDAALDVAVNGWSREERKDLRREHTVPVEIGPGERRVQELQLRFPACPESSYAIFAHQRRGDIRLSGVEVMVRRVRPAT